MHGDIVTCRVFLKHCSGRCEVSRAQQRVLVSAHDLTYASRSPRGRHTDSGSHGKCQQWCWCRWLLGLVRVLVPLLAAAATAADDASTFALAAALLLEDVLQELAITMQSG